jgi:outer membrane biosynthesis protein TonB
VRVFSQRGNVAVYLLFSLAASVGAGYGVYTLIKNRPQSVVDDSAVASKPAQRNRAHGPTPAPPEPMAPFPEPESPSEPAEPESVAPADIDDPPADTVLLGRPGVAGALEVAQVERTVKRYVVRYERCMRRARERHLLQRGQLRVLFHITPDGVVDYATVKASTVESELADCILDMIKKLRFDTSAGVSSVAYPFAFVPANGE